MGPRLNSSSLRGFFRASDCGSLFISPAAIRSQGAVAVMHKRSPRIVLQLAHGGLSSFSPRAPRLQAAWAPLDQVDFSDNTVKVCVHCGKVFMLPFVEGTTKDPADPGGEGTLNTRSSYRTPTMANRSAAGSSWLPNGKMDRLILPVRRLWPSPPVPVSVTARGFRHYYLRTRNRPVHSAGPSGRSGGLV